MYEDSPIPPSPDLVAFADLVHRRRRRAGLSQRQLAALVGLNQSSVSRLERAQLPGIQLRRLIPLLRVLGLMPVPLGKREPLTRLEFEMRLRLLGSEPPPDLEPEPPA